MQKNFRCYASVAISVIFFSSAIPTAFAVQTGSAKNAYFTKSDSWQFTVLSTGNPQDYLVDFSWKPFDYYGIFVGSRAGKEAIAYKYSDNSAALFEIHTASKERFGAIDWNATGSYAFITATSTVGGSNNVYLYDGTSFTLFYPSAYVEFNDVAFHPVENYALLVGASAAGGVVYEYNGTELKQIPIGFPTGSLNAVAWRYDGKYALIAGEGAIILYNRTAFTLLSNAPVKWQDVAWRPQGIDALLVGFDTAGGVVQRYDSVSLQSLFTTGTYLYGVSWKPSGSFALITGNSGCVLEYNGTSINRLQLPVSPDLKRLNFMFPASANKRYCYALLTGGGGIYLKYRQNDANVNANASSDFLTDAPNDFENAFELNSSKKFKGFLDQHDSSDWYKFNITAGTLISINLSVPPNADYNLRLYDENQNIKAVSAHPTVGTAENITFATDSSGWWRAEIYLQFGSGSYEADFVFAPFVSVTTTLLSPNGFEKLTGWTHHKIIWHIHGGLAPYQTTLAYSTDCTSWKFIGNVSSSAGVQTFDWLVPFENSTSVKVRVDVTDKLSIMSVDISDHNFTIDSTPPSIVVTSPQDRHPNIELDAPIIVTFTEPMNTTSCEEAFEIQPDPGGWHWSWGADNTTMTGVHNLFLPGTSYSCKMTAVAKDSSEPGNHLSTYSWTFTTTYANISVKVVCPNGLENFTVNTFELIRWFAEGGYGDLKIKLEYSATGKDGNYILIADNLSNTGEYNWHVSDIQTSYNCIVKATATDALGRKNSDISDSNFTIYKPVPVPDEPPRVTVFLPTGGETLFIGTNYTIKWFVTDDHELPEKPITIFLLTDAEQKLIASDLQNTGYYEWLLNETLNASSVCYINVSCKDTAGQIGFDLSGRFEISKPSADNPPTVVVVQPNGGEQLHGDDTYLIKWIATDDKPLPQKPIEIFYTTDMGSNWLPIAVGVENKLAWEWLVPNVDAACYVKVLCRDSAGQATVAVSNGSFKIIKRTLNRLEVTPAKIDYIHFNQKQQFIAKGFDAWEAEIKNLELKWSVSSTQLGTITNNGLFVAGTTELSGFVYVSAEYGGKPVKTAVAVNVSASIVNIESVEIQPGSAVLAVDEKLMFYAQAYSDRKIVGGVIYNWTVIGNIGVVYPQSEQFTTFTATKIGKGLLEIAAYHMGIKKTARAAVYVGISDFEPPQLEIKSVDLITAAAVRKLTVLAHITDNFGIVTASLYYGSEQPSLQKRMELTNGSTRDGIWKCEILISSDWKKVVYFVNATDGVNYNTTALYTIDVPPGEVKKEAQPYMYFPIVLCVIGIGVVAIALLYLRAIARKEKAKPPARRKVKPKPKAKGGEKRKSTVVKRESSRKSI